MNITVKIKCPNELKRDDIKKYISSPLEVKSIKFPLKPGGGRRRGNKFELDNCKELSLWWSNGESDKIFKRAGSEHTRDTSVIHGDMYSVRPEGFSFTDRIALEMKRVLLERTQFGPLLKGESKQFDEFWKQTLRQARMGKKIPLLFVKIDRVDTFCFGFEEIDGRLKLNGEFVPMCRLDYFMSQSPEEIIEWADEKLKSIR
jgi:hypothetical protein